jgi:hypothetical protein
MALSGVQAKGIEAAEAHRQMLERLRKRLAATFDPTLEARLGIVEGLYPDQAIPHIDGRTIVIVPSLGTTLTPAQEIAVYDALAPAAGVILGERMFFKVRETREERDAMIAEIRKRGFGEPEIVFAWDDWHFGFHPDRIIYLPRCR